MRGAFRIGVATAVLAAAGFAAWSLLPDGEATPVWRLATVERGGLVSAVTASGTVNPVVTVQVSSQLSGQIVELLVDYNSPVEQGQTVARLDRTQLLARQRQGEADVAVALAGLERSRAQAGQVRAQLGTARAGVLSAAAQAARADVMLKDGQRELERRHSLLAKGAGTTADAERAETVRDNAKAELAAARAQQASAEAVARAAEAGIGVAEAEVAAGEAQVAQRRAALEQVEVDLQRSEIRAPVTGVVVQRNIDVGQIVAASLQAPTLFTIAQDLSRMQVEASVDEADVGRVEAGQAAEFTVAAYMQRTFHGTVRQVRLAPSIVQNVVTYVVVVDVDNADQKLLPGMTANVRIVTAQAGEALKVPNAALRWRPAGEAGGTAAAAPADSGPAARIRAFREQLVAELKPNAAQLAGIDAALKEMVAAMRRAAQQAQDAAERTKRIDAARKAMADAVEALLDETQKPVYRAIRSRRRHAAAAGQVYVAGADGRPRRIDLKLGIGDGAFTQVLDGALKPGQAVIVGQLAAKPGQSGLGRVGL